MTLHVYAGPSLAAAELPPHAAICQHPPVAHGDLYRLRPRPGDAVLVVDGLYQHVAPVRHKEILSLCADGTPVYGTASIGALRAAELYEHGMGGLGTVFGWYRDGRLFSDADVALMHGDADIGFRPFTRAMVSILSAVDRLVADAAIAAPRGALLVDLANGIHFSGRGDAALRAAARQAGLADEMDLVLAAIGAHLGDIKTADAVAAIGELLERQPDHRSVPPPPDTSYRREWRLHHSPAGTGDASPTWRQVLAYAQLFRPDFPDVHTRYVLGHLSRAAPDGGATRWVDPLPAAELHRRGVLTALEAATLDPEARAIRALVRTFRLRPGRLVFEDLPAELRPDAADLTGQCARVLALDRQARLTNPTFHPADLPATLVEATFRDLWRVDDLDITVLDRGFRDVEDFRLNARPFFVAARAALAMRSGPSRREAANHG